MGNFERFQYILEDKGNVECDSHISSKLDEVSEVTRKQRAIQNNMARSKRVGSHLHFNEHEDGEYRN